MMDVGHPYAGVLPGAKGAILATLVRLERPVTVRELARQAEVSSGRAAEIVAQLASTGLVWTEVGGRAKFVRLNRDHLAASGVLALVRMRTELIVRLSAEIENWDNLAAGWLFGSAARGDGGIESDIDLLLVAHDSIETETWAEGTSRLSENVRRWTGNSVQLVEHTLESLLELVMQKNPLIEAIRREGVALTAETRTVQERLLNR